jgi:hypothetical protein
MKMNVILLLACFACLLAPSSLYSQKRLQKYAHLSMMHRVCDDTVILYSSIFSEFEVRQPIRNDVPQFVIDTSYREKIIISGKSYMIDSLLYRNYSEYSGSYDFECVYVIERKNEKYYIVSFFNAFQMGTMVQPCYLVFRSKKGNVCLNTVYMLTDIEDNSGRIENTVRVHLRNDDLYLTGKNLELLKSFK